MRSLVLLVILLLGCGAARPAVRAPAAPPWQPLSSAVFETAQARHALVLL